MDEVAMVTPEGLKELSTLLAKYKKYQDQVDEISRQTSQIVATSGVGQAPPVFHRLVQKQVDIMTRDMAPIWNELKSKIVPGSNFKTFWQEIPWTPGTLPPDYHEIVGILKKYAPAPSPPPPKPAKQETLFTWMK